MKFNSSKLENKNAVIGVIGLGYVGLPLLIRYSEVGYKVIGFDVDEKKVDDINNGKSYIEHIDSKKIQKSIDQGSFAVSDYSKIKKVDAIILCVPTPLSIHNEPDLSFITKTVDSIIPFIKKGQLISLESTTYPGTTEEELLPRIESTGLIVGTDIFLVYSPEREDPGNKNFSTSTIPKVIGGSTKNCLAAGISLYSQVINDIVPVSSTNTAEMTKLLENIHRAVNIGLVNEMKIVADKMGIDIHEVIRAASTKPFGFTPYYPGPGLGGHCIPIDPFYLTWKAKEFNINTQFIELAGEINTNMPKWVLSKVIDALNSKEKPLKNSKILVLGIAYKKNVDDMRESPAVVIMELLKEKGAILDYSDPYIPIFPKIRNHFFSLESIKLTPANIRAYDLLLLTTDHDSFDYELIQKNAKLIVDTRGVYIKEYPNMVKA
ncbi:nucleotide sugar dehydrogenase [Methylophilaceae bacterium Uisw_099_01]